MPRNGMRKKSIADAERGTGRCRPAPCPAVLAGADTPAGTSSMVPTAHDAATAPSTTPSGIDGRCRTRRRTPSSWRGHRRAPTSDADEHGHAAEVAASARSCTRRSSGWRPARHAGSPASRTSGRERRSVTPTGARPGRRRRRSRARHRGDRSSATPAASGRRGRAGTSSRGVHLVADGGELGVVVAARPATGG